MYISRKIVKQNNSNYVRTRYLAISGKLESTRSATKIEYAIEIAIWKKFICRDELELLNL